MHMYLICGLTTYYIKTKHYCNYLKEKCKVSDAKCITEPQFTRQLGNHIKICQALLFQLLAAEFKIVNMQNI